MTMDKKKYDEILADFSISDEELQKVSADFEAEMQTGLAGEDSTLRMLRSYDAPCTSCCTEAAGTSSSRRRRSP